MAEIESSHFDIACIFVAQNGSSLWLW
jgi:hypothetical protein